MGKWDKTAIFEGEKELFWGKSSVRELLEASRWRRATRLLLNGICEWG
jgi:hypothetical protein